MRINQFRPISLIGFYKIIAKILMRYMKAVIGKIIMESQSTFIKGQNILNGMVILNEVVEEARKS